MPGVRVDFDEVLGSPKFIASTSGFLATADGSSGGVTAERMAKFAGDDPQRAIKAFLEEYADLFGHGANALQGARVVRDYATERNGLRTVVWQQELDGLRIFESTLQAHVTRDGALVNVASRFVPDASTAAKAGTPQPTTQVARPAIDAKRAVSEAAKTVGENLPPARVAEAGEAEGPASKQKFKSVPLLDISTEKVWLPVDETALKLAWEVIFTSKARGEMFRAIIDAADGTPLVLQGLTEYLTDASYRVYTSDSPSPFSPGNQTPVTTQPPVVQRTLVTTGAMDTTASPNGWIDDGVNELRGNNVDAHTDRDANNVPDTPRPVGSPFRVFDFPVDLNQDPSTYTAAATTDLFYWNNLIHDRFYQLGFTEAAGNFQNNNFGRGGVGNDAVQADAQDGSGTNNANFSTPPDGSPGRMQMYVFTGPTPDRDGDFDHEIVIHEATHGLSNRLVGGGVGMSALQSRGMGEGWSDFYALCILSESTDNPNGAYAKGGYATYQLGGMTTNYYYGIRRYPYSTDLTKNPLTFKDIDPNLASAHIGVPLSPRYPSSNFDPAAVHRQGELWCVTLWEVRANLIAKHGAVAGNNLMLELATDAMKLSPANPNFLQSRDAILQADLVGSGGANHPELWKAFAKRGMGLSAVSPASTTTSGVQEAYDLPVILSVTPGGALAFTGPPGGPFTPTSSSVTIKNSSSATIDWSVTKTQSWLNITPTSGSLAPQATAPMIIALNGNANSLVAGQYEDTLTITSTGPPQTIVTRAVMLTVKEPAPPTRQGWPNSTGGQFNSVADLDNDGSLEVLSINSSVLRIFKHDATLFAGWPKSLSTTAVGPPSVADLDGDGVKEISIIDNNTSSRTGSIYLWKSDGNPVAGWPKNYVTGNLALSTTISPALADINGDGKIDIIYTSATSTSGGNAVINVVRMDGTTVSGWPVTIPSSGGPILATPAVADFDGDGQLDIAVVTFNGRVYVYRQNGTLFSGFPVTLLTGSHYSGSVTFADFNDDGRLELLAAVDGGQAAIYNSSGQVLSGWPKTVGPVPQPPSVADLDGDGDLEMAFGTQGGVVQVLHHTGLAFQGWPKTLPSRCYSPAIADLDDDGQLDLLATDASGNLHAWNRFGAPLFASGFPITLGSTASGPPLLADLDGNGTAETIAYASTLDIRDLASQLVPATTPWPVMFQDCRSISRYAPVPGPINMEPSRVDPGATTQLTITGDHFLKGMKVTIDGIAQVITAETATTLAVTTGGLDAPGLKNVVLSNVNFGTVTYANSFLVGWPILVAIPASANEGAGVLVGQGSITLATAPAVNTAISLQSSDPSEVTVPATVVVPAGQTQVAFDVTVVDDAQLDGSQSAVITATGAGVGSATARIVVDDNEAATLSLNIPASGTEGVGSVQGTVSVSSVPAADVTVTLTSNAVGEVQVPASVVIPSGQNSAVFPITIVDDGVIDGPQQATITARVANWADGSANFTVLDNESTALSLIVPTGIREGDTVQSGSVRISGTLPNALVVSLSSDDPSEVTVPSTVTIPAGQTTAAFSLTIVDDALTDGAQTASLTANAAGFSNGTGNVSVADNDVHRFAFGTIGNPQDRGVQFAVKLTAQDINGATITNYGGMASLTAAGTGGAVGVSPSTTTGGFQNGVWDGAATINVLASQVILTANDGSGHFGTSNTFNVVEGAADRFSWDPIASPQMVDTPFQVTLRALDAGGGPVSDYHGSPDLLARFQIENPTIGTGTTPAFQPITTYNHDLRTQLLYTATEVGNAAKIISLSLNVVSMTGAESLTNWTIRLKHTAKSVIASNSSWDNTDWTTVYRASPTISSTGWVTFTFSTPFNYDGISNLLVDLSMDRTTSNASYTYFQSTSTSQLFAMYGTSNSTNGDPLTWSGTTPYPSGYYARPNLRFSTSKELPIRPQRSGTFSNGVWSGEVSVPFAGTSASLIARAGTVSGTSNAFEVASSAPPSPGGAIVYSEDFESGVLDPAYWTVTGTGNYRTQITTYLPRGGSRHLAMDERLDSGSYARNEATVTLNLAGRTGVQLSFWAAQFGEESDGPPSSPFPSTGANFDGVAISADGGNHWYEVQPLRSLTGTYTKLTVDLDAALAARGLTYSSSFKIRFNQYDNYALGTDGIGIDDLLITADQVDGFVINAPAQVVEGAGSVGATVVLDSAAATDTIVALSSSAPAKISVPANVTIPAGQLSATFAFNVQDDTIPDGDRLVTVSGTVAGKQHGAAVTVRDNETLSLALQAPSTVVEGATAQIGTITLGAVTSGPMTFNLVSSDTTEIVVPASVVVPAGLSSASFPITVVNDTEIDGPQNATITVSRAGWTNATTTMQVTDNETDILALSGSFSAYEGASPTGTISLSGTMTSNLVVTLTSTNPAQYSVPASVTIPAGQTSVTFQCNPVDDTVADGSQLVTITASASGFSSVSTSAYAHDNDVHHFSFGTIPASVVLNQTFPISVIARDVNGQTITVFGGPVNFSASAGGASVPMTPAASGNFSSGVWNGSVKMTGLGTGVTITATDSGNNSGTSSAFNVNIGAHSSFAWGTVPSPVKVGDPVATTVTALDAFGNTVADFNGTASLSCDLPVRNVGTGTFIGTQPFLTSYTESRLQCIYLASELGGAGKLKELALDVSAMPTVSMTRFTVRIKPTTLSAYSSGSWETTGWTTVYQGNLTVTKTGWLTLPFTTPFQYDGTSNLMVDFSFDNVTSGSNGSVRSSTTSGTRACYQVSNGSYGDPLTWSGSTPTGYLLSYVPNLRLRADPSVPVTPATVTFTNGTWSGPVTLGAMGMGVTLTCRVADVSGSSNTFDCLPIAALAVTPTAGRVSTGPRGGPFSPLTHTFTVSNGGTESMTWVASSNKSWLNITPSGGTLQSGETISVSATLTASELNSLPGGSHVGAITFTNTTNSIGNTTRNVTVTASPYGELAVTPTTPYNAVSPKGGPASPSSRFYTLKNTGDANINWTASEQVTWLSLSSTSGTLVPNQSINIVATMLPSGLEVGNYNSAITFVNATNGRGNVAGSVAISVTLRAPTISSEPAITPGTSNTISWSESSGAQTYEAEVASSPDFTDARSSGWITATTYTFNSLGDGLQYYYRVRARTPDQAFLSAWSTIETSRQSNDPPIVGTIANQTVLEDDPITPILFAIGDDWTLAGNLTVSASASNPTLLPTNGFVFGGAGGDRTIQPTLAPDANGTAMVTLRVTDGMGKFAESSFEVVVKPVNDPPAFETGENLEAAQDSGLQMIPNWARQISAGPADEAGQQVDFQVEVSDSTLFTTPPAISPDGTLSYTPAPGGSGTATVTVRLHDNGGTSDGGEDLSDPKTFTIAITTFAEELGSYNGLVRAVDPAASTADQYGLIKLSIARGGKFTGKLTIGGKAQSLSGTFDQSGVAHFGKSSATFSEFKRTKLPPLRVSLQLDVAKGSDQLSGEIEDASGPFAVITADRSLFSTQKVPKPPLLRLPDARLGAYTVLFNPPASDLPEGQYPPGYGSASVVVSASGSVRMVATLADGTKFTYSNYLSKSFEWPLHFASTSAGCLNGPVQFEEDEINGGDLSWFRPVTKHAAYPQGWPNGILTELIGSKYRRPTTEAPVFADLAAPGEVGNLLATLTEGGLAEDGFEQSMNIGSTSKISAILPNENRLTMTLSLTTGLLSGSFKHPGTGKSTKFTGAVLQKQAFGAGSFSGPQGGSIRVAPRSAPLP